ncbi:hypothetical protein, partial [Ralstonia solanacearum]|uniref:hypothetical protein n=1 Tax=Ralstonia solanacearum TaxID=305 RepID=UPI001E524949
AGLAVWPYPLSQTIEICIGMVSTKKKKRLGNGSARRGRSHGAVVNVAIALTGNDATVEICALVATIFPSFVEPGATCRHA